MWKERAQVQEVFSLEGKKEDASSRGNSICDQAIRSIAKEVKKKSSVCPTIESTKALWRGHPR